MKPLTGWTVEGVEVFDGWIIFLGNPREIEVDWPAEVGKGVWTLSGEEI